MSSKPKILCIGDDAAGSSDLPSTLLDSFDIYQVATTATALGMIAGDEFAGMYVACERFGEAIRIGTLLQNERILDGMADGVILLDLDNNICWANTQFKSWTGADDAVNVNFYSTLGNPEILGPDFCPFHTALATRQASTSTLRTNDNRYLQLHAAPVFQDDDTPEHLIVTVRDVTFEMLQQQKLEAIHRAGLELADLTPEEIFNMHVEDRVELLKSNILHYTQDLLNFDVVEIRLLDQQTGRLEPLLSVGIEPDAANRPLMAKPQGNGVTGFVAATGKSYLCEDTTEDPLYIQGFKGARSSLTVPLIWHDQVIGSFNVESPEARAFTESDLQFLEIFSRDIAVALNTLELLQAQVANTAQQSVEAIHSAVALPIDEILNDAVNIMERYIGHEPAVVERLQRVLRNARDIKQVIQKVGQTMTPSQAVPPSMMGEQRPKLRGRRILVIDDDESVRNDAHKLLERYGCIVETAHEGGEAILMVRNSNVEGYDAVIADIRLPDISGYELFVKLKELVSEPPLVLMTGFGYDPGHSIVKARQAGLRANAVLYKPFRLDQLLETVEGILDTAGEFFLTLADMFDLDLLRWAAVLPGHVAVCAILYNRLHSLPLSKRVRDGFELLLMIWAATFLLLGIWLAFHDSDGLLPKPIETAIELYKLLCIAAIVGVACVWSWRKCTWRVPSMLLSNHTQSYNVAREIGRKPIGRLVSRVAATIPGNQLLELDVNEKTFAIPFLSPALDGLSITHLSDLHYTGQITREYFGFVVDRAQELNSDLIAVTGDLVDKHELIDWIPETLGRMHAEGGMYYVLGNHDKRLPDVGKLRSALHECGLVDLGSKWEEIQINGERILLSGNELVWFGPPPEPPPVKNEQGDRPLRILLSHSPDQLSWARHRQFDLMLAGHTHGGQIRLPFIGPIVAPSRFGVKYASSVYYEEPTLMHVSRGISAVHPVRLNCRPELTKIVLKCAKN